MARPPAALKNQHGYTLTELLVVLVILGLIAAAITPRIIGRLDSSKVEAARIQLDTLSASVDIYYIDNRRYPSPEEGLSVLLTRPDNLPTWNGPYVRTASNLIDPWGNPFAFEPPNGDQPARIISYGADGAPGGSGQEADLVFPDV